MQKFARTVLLFIVLLAVVAATTWASLALWYRLPGPDWMRSFGAGIFAIIGIVTDPVSLKLQAGCVFAAWVGAIWLGGRFGLTSSDKAALGKAGRLLRLA